MFDGKRKRSEALPSRMPLSFTPATPAKTDSRSPTLSPGLEFQPQKAARILEGIDCERLIIISQRLTKEEMQSLPEFLAIAFAERHRQARIYAHTKSMMRVRTNTMFALALRDYQRQQYAPTRRTRPNLHKRRYSVDVNSGKEKCLSQWVGDLPVQRRGRTYLLDAS